MATHMKDALVAMLVIINIIVPNIAQTIPKMDPALMIVRAMVVALRIGPFHLAL